MAPPIPVTTLRQLGSGGQMIVWLARTEDGEVVVFKQPRDRAHLLALTRELERAVPLVHPNIARVFGPGVDADRGEGVVSEYVDGLSLRAYLDRRDPLEAGELWPIARGIAAAIDHSHDCRVLHFDLKPENVMLRRLDWAAKLIDFGLAHRLEGSYAFTAEAAGTPSYMAPEVWGLRDVPAGDMRLRRADVYSLAVTLYVCLTKRRPFDLPTLPPGGSEWDAIRDAVAGGRYTPSPRIPGPAWQVLRAALSADRDRRPARAGLLVEQLREAWDRTLLVTPRVFPSDLGARGRPRLIVHPSDNAPMALVPAQRFRLGDDAAGQPDNRPTVDCQVDDFYIDVHPVTNRQFARFAREQRPALQGNWQAHYRVGENEDHPVRGVLYPDAELYCLWAGKELPLEIEWECAARTGDGRLYPWGQAFEDGRAHAPRQDGAAPPTKPAGVGGYAGFGYGLFDMAGNVFELVRGWYQAEFYQDLAAGRAPARHADRGEYRLVRGGCWESGPVELMTVARGRCDPDAPDPRVGFRTVWRPPA